MGFVRHYRAVSEVVAQRSVEEGLLELDREHLDSITETHPHVREVLQQFADERLKTK